MISDYPCSRCHKYVSNSQVYCPCCNPFVATLHLSLSLSLFVSSLICSLPTFSIGYKNVLYHVHEAFFPNGDSSKECLLQEVHDFDKGWSGCCKLNDFFVGTFEVSIMKFGGIDKMVQFFILGCNFAFHF